MRTLAPTPRTVHGAVSASLEPVIWIEPGERVAVSAPDVAFGAEPPSDTVSPRRKVLPEREELRDGPACVGPIGVRGAEPGMGLAVTLHEVVPAAVGYTFVGGGSPEGLADAFGVAREPPALVRWELDRGARVARSDVGAAVPLRPFPGTIGVAPPSAALVPGWPPRPTGGNLDCRELVAGSTLHLPVAAPGALLSLGDGHAAQGDGELAGAAIECALERVELSVAVEPPGATDHVWAQTPAGVVTFGLGADLETALRGAVNRMLDRICADAGLGRAQALAVASAAVDVRVTQVVNGTVGVHCLLPPDVLESRGG